ncbi:MAG TPA: endolytic transglycosylase MltG, partial [Terriglobales bacterium]|nr:endolytic transglycosylase MltG [Terriglobales bacterium]
QLVTLASLVESEARIDEERPIISAVYHNRLKIGMPLQCDPTVIYALGGLERPLNHLDLEVNSPYNTYKHPGLPPGPINNPGRASILAALFPANVNYLYFVAKGDGSHIFSVDLEEHNRAIAKIKRENKS